MPDAGTKKVLGYIRCSTNEQAESGLGMIAQAKQIAAYCNLRQLELLAIVTDPGESGHKRLVKRRGGAELHRLLFHDRLATGFVIIRLDRAFRNTVDCLDFTARCDKEKITLHVTNLGGSAVDTSSATGRFMLVVLAGAAEMERNLVVERTKAAMDVRREKGMRCSAVAPYGWKHVGDKIEVHPVEMRLLTRMIGMRLDGMGWAAIARYMNRWFPKMNRTKRDWERHVVQIVVERTMDPNRPPLPGAPAIDRKPPPLKHSQEYLRQGLPTLVKRKRRDRNRSKPDDWRPGKLR